MPLGRLHIRPLDVPSVRLDSTFTGVGCLLCPGLSVGKGLRSVVDRRGECPPGCPPGQAISHGNPLYRCVHDRLGSFPLGLTLSGKWTGYQPKKHIDVLEIRAVLIDIEGTHASFKGRVVCLATDISSGG